jgi:DNA-binding NtrC family response regulator
MSSGPELLWRHLPKPIQDYIESGRSPSPAVKDSLLQSREDVERTVIQRALMNCGFIRARAASALGISRVTLYKKMKKYCLTEAAPQRADQRPIVVRLQFSDLQCAHASDTLEECD